MSLDTERTAQELGFSSAFNNSYDVVGDRDFILELLQIASQVMLHLSRFAEDFIYLSSTPVGWIELPDSLCTGSSMMPQKKNPDVPELVRGKTGRLNGHLISLLTLMKSQPLAYNKDNQEDKEPIFDTVDTLNDCLRAYGAMPANMRVNPKTMYQAAKTGFSTATDLADYLVRKDTPFRDAHEIVGKAVQTID